MSKFLRSLPDVPKRGRDGKQIMKNKRHILNDRRIKFFRGTSLEQSVENPREAGEALEPVLLARERFWCSSQCHKYVRCT